MKQSLKYHKALTYHSPELPAGVTEIVGQRDGRIGFQPVSANRRLAFFLQLSTSFIYTRYPLRGCHVKIVPHKKTSCAHRVQGITAIMAEASRVPAFNNYNPKIIFNNVLHE